jgi:hypothetical protein
MAVTIQSDNNSAKGAAHEVGLKQDKAGDNK